MRYTTVWDSLGAMWLVWDTEESKSVRIRTNRGFAKQSTAQFHADRLNKQEETTR